MFKKLVTLMMVLAIFTVQANAGTQNNLKSAFDELNYSLTVEWNGKDKTFYNEQMKKFSTTLRELQANGLTNAELVSFVKSEVKDERVARDLETAFNMVSINKMNSADASKFMIETMKKSYASGARWNGSADALLYLGIGLLVVAAALALAAGASGSVGGGSNGGGGYCSEIYVCDTTCYNDYYYGYSCYDDCYYTCY